MARPNFFATVIFLLFKFDISFLFQHDWESYSIHNFTSKPKFQVSEETQLKNSSGNVEHVEKSHSVNDEKRQI